MGIYNDILILDKFGGKPKSLKSLLQFCEKNKLSSALVTRIDKEWELIFNDIQLILYLLRMPTWWG